MQPIEPTEFADLAMRWLDDGAQIIGGCCGIGPSHIAATREALNKRPTPTK